MSDTDLNQLIYDMTEYGLEGPLRESMLKVIEELASLRDEYKDCKDQLEKGSDVKH